VHQTAQNSIDRGAHLAAIHARDHFVRPHRIADLPDPFDFPVARRSQHARRAPAADLARHTRIWRGRAVPQHTAQVVPALRLDHLVAIDARRKAGAQREDERRVGEARAGVALGHHRVDQDWRRKEFARVRFRIDQDREDAVVQPAARLLERCRAPRGHALDGDLPIVHRAGKRDRAPHDERLRELGDDDRKTGFVQTPGDASAEVAGAFEEEEGGWEKKHIAKWFSVC